MDPLGVFTVRELRERSGELLRDAEQGKLALITKRGRPAILAVPFDERLLSHGVHRALALHLFEGGQVTLSQGARLAGLPIEGFFELLAQTGIVAVSYPPEDLEAEVQAAR